MKNIAVFISGTGSNAARMLKEFRSHSQLTISCIISTKKNKEMAELCTENGVQYIYTGWSEDEQKEIYSILQKKKIDWIILAGFLKLIPVEYVSGYEQRIINLHPALLPKFGGKGMYGMNVHKAVISAGEKKSGITIHYVNSQYDEGRIIKQFSVDIESSDDENSLFEKIRRLEVIHFVKVVEQELLKSD
jgi:phosphoribosylglycinamide formyltransferase-1